MKTILIIEDNPTKLSALEDVVRGSFDVIVTKASSISNAYATLGLRDWDLIILDMTFQASQGAGRETSKEALAGIEVLQYIQRMGKSAPVIVATQHTSFASGEFSDIDSPEDLHSILKEAFPAVYRETVRVDLATEAWKEVLCYAIKRVWGRSGAVKRSNS